ncbi:MAG TPA: hypothetical protein VHY33_10405 [Thermoanaerobaculia bacterium]|jgi:hypothetical protein|nr:hypothetical protein [Thermoanaerobaculia bacterium]
MGTHPDVNGRGARVFLIVVAMVMAGSALLFFVRPPEIGSPALPTGATALASRLARHPTDWEAATLLTEVSLDSPSDKRIQLWRAAYDDASHLAPERPGPASSFARAAFFHWQELSPKDRQDVLTVYAPLLADEARFARMAQPLFELTGDLTMLERSRPRNEYATGILISLALRNGLFEDYRKLREDLQRERLEDFTARARSSSPADLIAHFPDPPYRADSEPLIVALLDELHRRPLDEVPGRPVIIDSVVDYALRHNLEPLDGLELVTHRQGAASDATRIRLARKLGENNVAAQIELANADPRRLPVVESDWQELCGNNICYRAWRNIEANHAISLNIETAETDNVPAYAEVYVDDVRRGEGEVGAKRDFIVPVGNPGTHRVEVVLANPVTRNGGVRRLRISGVTTL